MSTNLPLFSGRAEDWHNNACLNFSHNQWDLYAEGFRRGTEVLVEHALNSSLDVDLLVYPIVFCCRHHIELRLKQLILVGVETQ